MLSDLLFRLRSLFRRNEVETELDDEVRAHFEHQVEKIVNSGIPREEAIRRARLAFGGVDRFKEECREARGVNFVETLVQDLRYGVRMLRKNPGFTAVAIFTLALGIGANTAVFSLVNGVVLRSLPFAEPGRLVGMTVYYTKGAYVFLRGQTRTMDLAAYSDERDFNWTGIDRPTRLTGTSVSAGFFTTLGVQPTAGRTFREGEDQPGKDREVVLSNALWQTRFRGNANVIGSSIVIEGVSRQIVGVMPPDFRFPSAKTELWLPLNLDSKDFGDYWGSSYMPMIARLRPGVSIEKARAELASLLPSLRAAYGFPLPAIAWANGSLSFLQEQIVGDQREKLLILLGAVGLLLLIACANVANLLLVRATTRQKEVALRTALGAGRWRITRQLVTESVLLAFLGGALGVALAVYGLPALKTTLPADMPRLAEVSVDGRVLSFAAFLMLLTGIIFGAAPAIGASKVDLTKSLKSGGERSGTGGHRRVSSSLVVGEVAISVVLVIGAGLLVKTLWRISNLNPGFRRDYVLTARITPNESFCEVPARCLGFYDDLLHRVRALPGITQAAAVNGLPLGGGGEIAPMSIEAQPTAPGTRNHMLWIKLVTPEYLRVMGIPLLRGRSFADMDAAPNAERDVLVSKSTAERYWPGKDPIGQRVKPVFQDEWRTVVGVVGDVNEFSMTLPLMTWLDGVIYVPYGPHSIQGNGKDGPPAEMTLVMRTSQDQIQIGPELQSAVAGLNQDVPVSQVETLQTWVSDSVAAPRSTALLFSFFSALAVVLAAVGIYGVISYSVAQRTREIGIRMALGARPQEIVRLVVGQGAKLALAGIVVGLGCALALTRLMATLLYGVRATDPFTFFGVAVMLLFVAIAASYIPARRAMRVDPMVALRHE